MTVPTIRFPEDKLEALHKSPASLYTHVAPEYGEGAMGFLDVFHQLHCLVGWLWEIPLRLFGVDGPLEYDQTIHLQRRL